MSDTHNPALPDLDALRAQLDETTLWLSFEIIRAMHRAMLTADDGAVTFHEPQTIASAVRERLTPVLDYAASLQRERDELRIEVATMRCIHTGSGLPLCRTCDPRTTDEGGPQPVSRNTTTEGEERASHADPSGLPET